MTTTTVICIAIFLLTLVGFATAGKRYSLTMVAMASMVLMVLAGCLKPATALGCFSNANAILMAAMFVVSAAFNRTQTIKRISGFICRVSGGSFTKVTIGYIVLSFIQIGRAHV